MPLRLYNTLTGRLELFVPRDPSRVTFYTCGPTVYDYAHIGNFRSFLAADVLRRWIESPLCELATSLASGSPTHKGPRTVVHVMNITDVGHMTDDAEGGEHGEDRMAVAGKRLAEAKKSGKLPPGVALDPANPYDIARFYEAAFKEDSRKLGLKVILDGDKDPTLNPRATENVPGMIAVVQKLIERGFAYVVGQPGSRVVYFDVQKFQPYGTLSGNTLDALRSGAGGRVDESNQATKKHPADFLLWKEDPSHIMKWDSPWGKGYPGWHIECTVMSARRLLGDAQFQSLLAHPDAPPAIIDLHSGGEDNIFPHHECEIAQSSCAFCADPSHGTFSTMWFHPRFLLVEGAKMSKSKGNFYTLRDLLEKGIEPAAIRLELIKTHYRSNANFTFQGLTDSQRTVDRWRRFAEQGRDRPGAEHPAAVSARVVFADSLNEDLNIAAAIAAVNTFVGEVATPTKPDAETLHLLDAVLGVLSLEAPKSTSSDIGLFIGIAPDAAINAKLEERRAARAAKDFKKSDQIRDELLAMGYAIKDVAGGKVEVTRK
jgi:cysteinyl-tRNA synthetase